MRLGMKAVIGIVAFVFMAALFVGPASANGKVDSLVETKWLSNNLSNVKIVFVDNWPSEKSDFDKGHIPGSVYMGIGKMMGAIGNGTTPPDKAKFEVIMHNLGINNDDHVVFYGAKGTSVFTLGAVWLMEYFGHDKVSFLNGGLEKWNNENLKTVKGQKRPAPGKFKAGTGNNSILSTADHVLKNLNNKNVVLVDARGTETYTGKKNEGNKRVGHIPGALDLGYDKTNFNSDGTVKSVADLKAVYEASGVTADKEVITYCQGGIKAANTYFTLTKILGYKNVKVYVGSWGEWARLDYSKYPIVGEVVE